MLGSATSPAASSRTKRSGSPTTGASPSGRPVDRGVRTWPRAFRWTADVGIVDLGTFEDSRPSSRATGVSADGRSSGAPALLAADGRRSGAQRRPSSGWATSRAAPDGRALAIAPDATVVVGVGTGQRGPEAFRWSARSPLSGLGDLPGGATTAKPWRSPRRRSDRRPRHERTWRRGVSLVADAGPSFA